MAKGDRWSDDPDVKVREMRNAETVLGVISERSATRPFIENGRSGTRSKHRPLASRLRSKDSRAVLRGADGKGRSRLPVTADAYGLTKSGASRTSPAAYPTACTVVCPG